MTAKVSPRDCLRAAGADPRQAADEADTAVHALPKVQGGDDRMYAAVSFTRALDTADQAATKAGDSYVTAERLAVRSGDRARARRARF